MLIYGLLRIFGDQLFDRLHRLFLVAAVADDRQLDRFAGRRAIAITPTTDLALIRRGHQGAA